MLQWQSSFWAPRHQDGASSRLSISGLGSHSSAHHSAPRLFVWISPEANTSTPDHFIKFLSIEGFASIHCRVRHDTCTVPQTSIPQLFWRAHTPLTAHLSFQLTSACSADLTTPVFSSRATWYRRGSGSAPPGRFPVAGRFTPIFKFDPRGIRNAALAPDCHQLALFVRPSQATSYRKAKSSLSA